LWFGPAHVRSKCGFPMRSMRPASSASFIRRRHASLAVERAGASELKQIILHEMAHLDRGDDWTNLLQKLLRALCPLNPALFWAERHLCLEREQACDDAVLDAAGNARAYATCLTKLAETRLVKRALCWRRACGSGTRNWQAGWRTFSIAAVVWALAFPRAWSRLPVASLSGVLLLQRCPGIITFCRQRFAGCGAGAPAAGSPELPSNAGYSDQNPSAPVSGCRLSSR
jgi:hypothetical protein